MNRTADIVICGAGITGPVVAHYLSRAGTKNILLLEAGRLRHSRPGVRESRLETFLTV